MEESNIPYGVPDPAEKEVIINSLLTGFVDARKHANFPTNNKGFDEDVNLYVAHLLFAIAMPNYHGITEQYISLHSTEVVVLADMAEDVYLQYFIYKVNADNLFVHLGIYQDLALEDFSKRNSAKLQGYIDTAKQFYVKAVELNKKIYKRKTAIADVLVKISKNIDVYIKALSFMRKQFFTFLNRFEDNEFSNFLDHMRLYEKKMEFESKQNLFLDLYAQWLKDKSKKLKIQINSLCAELHELDGSFNFKL